MLILTRHNGERVRLRLPDGTTIWITVDQIRTAGHRDRHRLCIDAPRSVEILREEAIREPAAPGVAQFDPCS